MAPAFVSGLLTRDVGVLCYTLTMSEFRSTVAGTWEAAQSLHLSRKDRELLEAFAGAVSTPQKIVLRARWAHTDIRQFSDTQPAPYTQYAADRSYE